jgi:Spy/CpxP family protein refolding chaperone
MRHLAAVSVFLIAFVPGAFPIAESARAADEPAADAGVPKAPAGVADIKVLEIPADSPKNPVKGGPNDQDARWWNDTKIVKALSLTDEQRKKMNERLTAYHAKVPENRKPETFHETLVQGDWKAARGENEKLAKTAAKGIEMRGMLKIDILSLLSEEQRKALVDKYPRLIYKPWRRVMLGNSSR